VCTMSQLLSAGQQEINVVKQKRSRKRKRDALKEKMLQEWELVDNKKKKVVLNESGLVDASTLLIFRRTGAGRNGGISTSLFDIGQHFLNDKLINVMREAMHPSDLLLSHKHILILSKKNIY
jgi:hypothetical protein